MKIEFSSQRREMLLFLTTNMAAVTSRANQQLGKCDECKDCSFKWSVCSCLLVHWFLSVSGRFILIVKFTVLSSGFIVRNAMVVFCPCDLQM